MAQIEVSVESAPLWAQEFVGYMQEQNETVEALAGLVSGQHFEGSSLGQSFLSDIMQYFKLENAATTELEISQWVGEQAAKSSHFAVAAGMYLEGVKYVADCLLMKKAS